MSTQVLKVSLIHILALLVTARRIQSSRVNVLMERELNHQQHKIRVASVTNQSKRQILSQNGAFAIGPTHVDVETTIQIRECLLERAQDWVELHSRLGVDYTYLKGHENQNTPTDLVQAVFDVEDKVSARSASRNVLQRWLHWDSRSSRMREWKAMEKKTHEALEAWGFNIHAARDRCAKGMNENAYTCMLKKACTAHEDCQNIKDDVRRRIDLKDLVAHFDARSSWWSGQSDEEKQLWAEVDKMSEKLQKHHYNWKDNKLSCRKQMHDETERLKTRTLEELSAGEKVNGVCGEATDKMCPEGTYATEKRRWDLTRGSAVTGTAFLIAKFTLLPLGSAIGTSLFGPAGATAGFIAGNALVAPIAFLSGWLASRGPVECGCFPRDCEFEPEAKICRMTNPDDAKSKNPFSQALPLKGMKCALYYKSDDSCGLQQCTLTDYTPELASVDMYGTLGHKDKDLYNCLSTQRTPMGAVSIVDKLPGGEDNTLEHRIKVYEKLMDPK